MTINLISPTVFVTSVVIGDASTAISGGSYDVPPALTEVAGVPVSAALEIQSVLGGLLLPRMTTAQMNAIITPIAGLMIFNTTTATPYIYQAGVWTGNGSGTVTSITAGTNLTGGIITASGTIALSDTLVGLTSVTVDNIVINNDAVSSSGGGGITLSATTGGVVISPGGANGIEVKYASAGANAVPLRLFNHDNTFFVALKASVGAMTASYVLTFPINDGDAGQVLSTDGNGNLSWINN